MSTDEFRTTRRPTVAPDLERRRFLGAAAGTAGFAGLVLAGCSSSGQDSSGPTTGAPTTGVASPEGSSAASSSTVAAGETCTLTREVTAGPYYLDDMAVRTDITEDRSGFPLALAFTVIDATTCRPLADAAVDVWHCDAGGEYSGWNGNTLAETSRHGRNDKTYLRGIQLTNTDGVSRFTTIYPGWYEGRAIHIHLKVHTDGHVGTTYEGGHVAHVGQVYFDDDRSDTLMKLGAYAAHVGSRTRNEQDSLFAEGGAGQIVAIRPVAAGDPEAGFEGTITVAVEVGADS